MTSHDKGRTLPGSKVKFLICLSIYLSVCATFLCFCCKKYCTYCSSGCCRCGFGKKEE